MAVSEKVIQKRLAALDNVAREIFGYADGMRPLQREVTEPAIRGQDVLLVMPTGGGKSFCFQGPALVRPGVTVVISPLIALMKDQVDKLRKWGINAEWLSADMDFERQRSVLANLPNVDLVYVAPERVKTPAFLDALDRCRVAGIAVDEAHCLAKWGQDFRSSYAKIGVLRQKFPHAPIIAVTATADEESEASIVRITGLRDYKRIVVPPDRPNLTYFGTSEATERQLADKVMAATATGGAAVVYAATRAEVERIAAVLTNDFGVRNVAHYHAGMDPILRTSVQDRFLSGELSTICATNAFGMGVDKTNVRLVYHWHHPGTVFDYAQEAGRAGRDGLPSECWLNVSHKGTVKREYFIRMANPALWVYQRLWRILTRGGRETAGATVRTSEAFLINALKMKEGLSGQISSAMGFMEFSRQIEVNPGPVTYRLPILKSHAVRSFMARFKCVKMEQNVCVVTVTPEEDDPVGEMVRSGAVRAAPPTEQKLIKLLKTNLEITDDTVDRKRNKAEAQHRAVRQFISAKDKPAYLRSFFLKG